MNRDAKQFAESLFGITIEDPTLFERALTHGSRQDDANYQRLEFLGDRVLGLIVAQWLYERFPREPEGKMNRRLSTLVARETCAEVGRAIGLPNHIRLSKQAREARAELSDNVVGDVVEALLGALYLTEGLATCDAFVRAHWKDLLETQRSAPVHPKNALQEMAAAMRIGTPRYELVSRSGPHHAPSFVVRVTLAGDREAEGEGTTKQEAESAAAATLLGQLK
ncbi:ribonuclease III [Sphingomicrobium clamense]|uniref:Ribonuclease 3 n=1 Tax=Sphingomicrobium clamense TaxID=2851013 RepID=A0ABS6V5B6_9SPHN|nr:ribonuclease III [Sphingomicrobium sp. B8]MBW0144748.1 ribonuclease III [Sphingomicrobium sp. B8]